MFSFLYFNIYFTFKNIKKYEIDNLSDLHKCLCDYNLEFKKALIKQLNCNIIVYSKILNSLKEKEYGYFESITSEYKIDLSDIIEICSFHESFILTEIDNSSTLKKIYNDKVINLIEKFRSINLVTLLKFTIPDLLNFIPCFKH